MTERQVDTLIAIVSHHRVFDEPVTMRKLVSFTRSQVAVLTSHLCRLVQYRLVSETKTGFVPTLEGEIFVITCRCVGEKNFGHTVLSMYAPT